MVGRWSGGGREVVGGGREVVGRWSGGGGRWSEMVGVWSEGGREVVGNWLAVVVWRLSQVLKVWYCWSFTYFHIWVMQCNSSRDLLFKHGLYPF